ncbi:MAG: 1-acyl-sn-glycerol-3-phosphate acyltransferase [Desulfovibrio sp.]|jgi:1-acyl-sn-glycerol-3-phosphate acyltransferase|nr:1-acyl-sn-glycerol-3-phosphate acyltransferase [Desulfovibrio sp.]
MSAGDASGAACLRFNIVFFGGLFLWTLLYLPISFCLWFFPACVGRRRKRADIRKLVHFYGVVVCRILGSQAPLRVKNLARQFSGPCIVAPNHQSFFDAYCLGFFHLRDIAFAVRAWPFRIPLYGRVMRRAGYLDTSALDAESFAQKAGELLDEGAALIIFPEGTRSTQGRMGRFHSGAFRVALRFGVPVVPLCIDGSWRIFPKGSRLGRPAPMRVSLLEPVWPGDFARYGDEAPLRLRRHVKRVIEKELDA